MTPVTLSQLKDIADTHASAYHTAIAERFKPGHIVSVYKNHMAIPVTVIKVKQDRIHVKSFTGGDYWIKADSTVEFGES